MRPVFPAIWLSVRGVWVALGLSVVLAVASVVPGLIYLFAAAAVASLALIAADAWLGPSARTLHVVRRNVGHIALRRPGAVVYDVENRARVPVKIGLIESPVANLDFAVDTVTARIAERSAVVLERPYIALERGLASFGAVYVWVENGIGLLRRRYRVDAVEAVRVLPDL